MAWASVPSIAILSVGAALLLFFALVERRAAEPILPWLDLPQPAAQLDQSRWRLGWA